MSVKFNKVSKDLLDTIKDSPKKGTTPYDSVAEVVRIDGNTAWVHIAGGVEETPVMKTIDCKEGDNVQIRVSGGTAWVTGNSSAPPTDDTRANVAYNFAEIAIEDALKARESAENAERDAGRAYVAANSAEEQAQRAQTSADNAQDSAEEATRQAGIATTNASEAIRQAGVATTNANEAIRQAGIAKSSADDAMASAVSATNSANSALTQLSTVEEVVDVLNWITEHGTYKASTDTEVVAGKFYFTRTGSGTTADPYVYTVVTNPTGNPSTSGYYELDSVDEAISNYVKTHLALTDEGLYLVKDGSGYKLKLTDYGEYIVAPNGTVVNQMTADGNIIRSTNGTVIAHLGYGEGSSASGTSNAPYYTFGTRDSSVAIGTYSVVEGISNEATAECAHAEGKNTEARGSYSHAEGYNTSAYGDSSHAEGNGTKANHYSHAEGVNTNASGIRGCHAEGQQTESSGEASHSEGYQTVASAFASHAEGDGTQASAPNSHAEGTNTVASGASSHAEGYGTQANGEDSHAEGTNTIANGDAQTALGKHNVADATSAVIIGNGVNSSNRSNALTVDWKGNVDIASGAKYKINGNNLSASDIANSVTGVKGNSESSYRTGNVNLTPTNIGAVPTTRKVNNKALSSNITLSASDVSAVPTTRTVNSKALSANITLSASDVGALPLSGGTMTGQIKTSFKESVAMGSYGATASTVDGLVSELRFSSGCMGSASISTAYTKGSVTIGTGWYNFIYSPHRSGGANGAASGDNCNYGNLLLMGMTVGGAYLIRVASAAIQEVKILGSDYVRATFTPTSGSSYSSYGGCYYEKYGRVVHVHVGVSGLSTGASTNIYTLPSGYRPTSPVFAHGTGGSWNNIGYMEISTAGVVTVRSQGTYCGADVTFMV